MVRKKIVIDYLLKNSGTICFSSIQYAYCRLLENIASRGGGREFDCDDEQIEHDDYTVILYLWVRENHGHWNLKLSMKNPLLILLLSNTVYM
jgi:hypothetical protein